MPGTTENPTVLTMPRHLGWHSVVEWEVYGWLSDETAYPYASEMNPRQMRNIWFTTEVGRIENRGRMSNAWHPRPGIRESVDVGRDIARTMLRFVDWCYIYERVTGNKPNPPYTTEPTLRLVTESQHPANFVRSYFLMGGPANQETGNVLTSALSRMYNWVIGALYTGAHNTPGAAVREYVEMKLWGEKPVPANICTSAILTGLSLINWDALALELFQMDDEQHAVLMSIASKP